MCWAEAVDDLGVSGATGLDTGLAVGWWALPGLHPGNQHRVGQHKAGRRLDPELRMLLTAHRLALARLVDTAA